MGGGQAGNRGVTRLLAVCAVLFGLFFMHGAPATAAGGCHGAMPAMSSPMSSSMSDGHDLAPVTMGHAPGARQPGLSVRHADASGMPGVQCVSTPASQRIPLPTPGLLAPAAVAVPAFWMPAGLRAAVGRTGRRGPPTSGRDLLHQVCVART
ncbi:hypothetical protein [Streptomyces fagopyri]|uniref:hypothetical protein n=1 Tax=Streptomyces fagopyri TaxID=2662397 RepID=UPI00381F1D11